MAGPRITTDKEHQARYRSWVDGREYDGLFADPGTGKTRMDLTRAMTLYGQGKIDAAVVVTVNSVKTSWVAWPHMLEDERDADQVTTHLGDDDVIKGLWIANGKAADKQAWSNFEKLIARPRSKLIVLVVNYEALLTDQFFAFLKEFCAKYRSIIVLDESTRIGRPGSKRTKRAMLLSKFGAYRNIATGTPMIKTPLKIYSQAKFLSPQALGFTSFYSFRNRYCVMGGWKNKQVVDFVRLDELADKIAQWSFRIRLEDCIEMPPRDWKKHAVYMTPEQGQAYRTMRQEFYASVEGTEITASIVLAQMTRLAQITGGFVSKDGKDYPLIPPERNPKLLEALEIIENSPGQSVVWFRFVPELKAMGDLLAKEGISFYEFHGEIPGEQKLAIRKSFFRGDRQVILGTASSGGVGIDEFKVARDAIFVSRDFDTEQQEQTERRHWRIGVDEPTRYHDVFVPNTVDTKIQKVLKGDAILSAKVLREHWRDWI